MITLQFSEERFLSHMKLAYDLWVERFQPRRFFEKEARNLLVKWEPLLLEFHGNKTFLAYLLEEASRPLREVQGRLGNTHVEPSLVGYLLPGLLHLMSWSVSDSGFGLLLDIAQSPDLSDTARKSLLGGWLQRGLEDSEVGSFLWKEYNKDNVRKGVNTYAQLI